MTTQKLPDACPAHAAVNRELGEVVVKLEAVEKSQVRMEGKLDRVGQTLDSLRVKVIGSGHEKPVPRKQHRLDGWRFIAALEYVNAPGRFLGQPMAGPRHLRRNAHDFWGVSE